MLTIENKILEEKLYITETDNGIKLFVYPKADFKTTYAIFTTRFGSNDTSFYIDDKLFKQPNGIAHFLEHKVFESEAGNIFEKFQSLGSSVNAYTSFNQTSYLFSSTEDFYSSLELLVSFVQTPHLTKENVEKEKGIIEQEIKMYNDDPEFVAYFNLLKALYKNHPIREDIAGNVESVYSITLDELELAYSTFYHPNNMVLFVVGDVDLTKTIEIVNMAGKKYSDPKALKKVIYDTDKEVFEKRVTQKQDTSKPIFYIGFKDNDLTLQGEGQIRKEAEISIINNILFSQSSELYQKLYTEQIIDSSFSKGYSGDYDYGYSFISGYSHKMNELEKEIDSLIDKPLEYITEEAFKRVKSLIVGNYLQAFDSCEGIANLLTSMYLKNYDIFNYLALLETINYENIIKRFHGLFKKDRMAISIIEPLEEE